MKMFYALSFLLTTTFTAQAMDFSAVRLSVWSKGETIAGEEFVAATEAVVDYLATLPRPAANTMKALRYNCQVKTRYIRPDIQTIGANPPISGWTEIRTVYDLKDCAPARD